MIEPKRWHIYVVDLEPRLGTKPGKQHPCLCVQPTEFCEAGLRSAVILPLTSTIHKTDLFPLRVHLPKGTCSLEKASDILVDQILAWDISLFRKDLGPISEALQEIVSAALRDFLDL